MPDPKQIPSSEAPSPPAGASGLFREEALRLHLRARDLGDVLERPPRWTRWAFPLVVAALFALVAWAALADAPREALSELLSGQRGGARP